MPTYEYACSSCGEHLEVVQSFRDDPLTTCPACGGRLRKVFGSVGVVFKGSGFYKTDSRPAKSATGAKEAKETKETAGAGSASSSSSDSSASGSKEPSSSSGSSAGAPGTSSSSNASAAAS